MTTRRERLEAKIEKREEWAAKAAGRSASAFKGAGSIADGIPFGQPILVGHHSEGKARRDQDRIFSGMSKGVAEQKLAAHHSAKAAGLEAQLDRTIFTDDDNATAALEARIMVHEAQRDKMKSINAAFKKGDAAKLLSWGIDYEVLRAQVDKNYSWDKQPYPAYELTNLGARIRTDKKRLAEVKDHQERQAKVDASDSGVIIEGSGKYVRITFADKPSRDVLNDLRAAGYTWGGGSWTGERAALPESVQS